MLQQTIRYSPTPTYPFFIVAKRYWLPEFERHIDDTHALTLIILHSTSFHKETWEPTIERLFQLAVTSQREGNHFKLREAWAIDCPNHGESALLNEQILKLPKFADCQVDASTTVSCQKYAEAVHHFLTAGKQHGAQVDFQRRRLVGIGHSLGGNAMLLLQGLEPVLKFTSLVIVEPMMSPCGPHVLNKLRDRLVQGAQRRNDTWPDREAALRYLQKRELTSKWDPRVLNLFATYAIVKTAGSHPNVTLACTRQQETVMYMDREGSIAPVAELTRLSNIIPVHLILGSIHDYIPNEVHRVMLDPQSGRKYTSVTEIKNVGHLVPQIVPDLLASTIYQVLSTSSDQPPSSKM